MMISPAPHNNTVLVLRRTFTASRERVFRAWITPRALESWLRPRGKSMTVRSLEARVGGSFRFDLEDGSSMIGTYLQIVPPEKLVFTCALYRAGESQGFYRAFGIQIVTLDTTGLSGQIAEVTIFNVPSLVTSFGFPLRWPERTTLATN